MSLCPLSVDWQSPNCKSQILMVLSSLPLAICFPSGLHATELTLYLWEVRTRINRNQEEKLGGNTYSPEFPVTGHSKTDILNFLHYIIFEHVFAHQKLPFRVFCTQNRKYFVVIFSRISMKKTHPCKWPVSVDWQSPDRESQILMVLSRLPLAICFPSGLHATDSTLKLREVSNRINTKKRGKIENLTIPSVRSLLPRTYKNEITKIVRKLTCACAPSASTGNL